MSKPKPKYDLHARFIAGLREKHDMEPEDLNDWWAIGGIGTESAENYLALCRRNPVIAKLHLPQDVQECVCYKKIVNLCYITNGIDVLVVGRCCILQFGPEATHGRNCEVCHKPHRNRKVNRCNDHKAGICDTCFNPCKEPYTRCYRCKFQPKTEAEAEVQRLMNKCALRENKFTTHTLCGICSEVIEIQYKLCYRCNFHK